jgi:hypothetical protein
MPEIGEQRLMNYKEIREIAVVSFPWIADEP